MPDSQVLSIIGSGTVREADVALIGVPYEGTVSSGKGTAGGPNAIRHFLDTQIELRNPLLNINPIRRGVKIGWQNVEGVLPEMKVEEMLELVEQFHSSLEKGQFAITVGGEHSVTLGALRALAKIHDPESVTILQIDAHLDLRKDDSDYNAKPHGPFAHSCVMGRAADLGFNIVALGIRDYSGEESDVAKNLGARHSMFEWPLQESDGLLAKIWDRVRGKTVYITLDVDGLDPSVMPATGTPVSDGLTLGFTRRLIQSVFAQSTVVGADVVEVIARKNWKDNHSELSTVRNAAQLVYDMICLHHIQNPKWT